MFESLKEVGRRNATRYLTSLLISLVAHTVVLGVLVVLPLVFLNVLHADELVTILMDPPSVPAPPPIPMAPTAHRPGAGPRVFKEKIDLAPNGIPHGIAPPDDSEEPIGIGSVLQGIGISTEGRQTGTVIDSLLDANQPNAVAPPQPPRPRIPIRVSGAIQGAKLIHKVDPVYPEPAIRAHVSGIVNLEAVIDEEGNVTDLKILDGHPLLTEAAYSAVKQWKYLPTMIGGEPVRVLATVAVIFRFR